MQRPIEEFASDTVENPRMCSKDYSSRYTRESTKPQSEELQVVSSTEGHSSNQHVFPEDVEKTSDHLRLIKEISNLLYARAQELNEPDLNKSFYETCSMIDPPETNNNSRRPIYDAQGSATMFDGPHLMHNMPHTIVGGHMHQPTSSDTLPLVNMPTEKRMVENQLRFLLQQTQGNQNLLVNQCHYMPNRFSHHAWHNMEYFYRPQYVVELLPLPGHIPPAWLPYPNQLLQPVGYGNGIFYRIVSKFPPFSIPGCCNAYPTQAPQITTEREQLESEDLVSVIIRPIKVPPPVHDISSSHRTGELVGPTNNHMSIKNKDSQKFADTLSTTQVADQPNQTRYLPTTSSAAINDSYKPREASLSQRLVRKLHLNRENRNTCGDPENPI